MEGLRGGWEEVVVVFVVVEDYLLLSLQSHLLQYNITVFEL